MNTRGMIVVDEAHSAAGKTLQEMCNLLDKEIATYINILNRVTTEAAKAGHTTTRYQEYAGLVTGLKGQLERLGTMLSSTVTNFVADINAADSYLY